MVNPLPPNEGAFAVTTYHGSPSASQMPGEKSKWKSFLKKFSKWWAWKWLLGNEWVEAKVLHEKADAAKSLGEAAVHVARARQIAMETTWLAEQMDRKKAIELRPILDNATTQDCERLIQTLQERLVLKVQDAKEKHGTQILVVGPSGTTEPLVDTSADYLPEPPQDLRGCGNDPTS